MATAPSTTRRAWYLKPLRIAHAHIKLVAAAAVGIVLFFVLPSDLRATTRALIAWNVALALYLAVAVYVIGDSISSASAAAPPRRMKGAASFLF